MIPQSIDLRALKKTITSDKTFMIDFDNGCIGARISGIEAIKQAAVLNLATERYEHLIHSWDYGLERVDLIGLPQDIAIAIFEVRVKEALLTDPRITSADSFVYSFDKGNVVAEFVVHSNLGDFDMQTEVI